MADTKGLGRNEAPHNDHPPGMAAGEHSLAGAVEELHKQHPHGPYAGNDGIIKSHSKINKRPFSPGPGY